MYYRFSETEFEFEFKNTTKISHVPQNDRLRLVDHLYTRAGVTIEFNLCQQDLTLLT